MKSEERRWRCQEEQNEGRRRVRKNGSTVENVLAQIIANDGWVMWSELSLWIACGFSHSDQYISRTCSTLDKIGGLADLLEG